jgi:hypothetical protein
MKNFFESILYFKWTVSLLKWMILVAGTVSECFFLLASIYLCLNSSVHSLILTVTSEATTVHLAELSTAIFIALPECIVFLAVVKTLSHFQTYRYTKDKTALVWSILFGLPTVTFAILTIITISEAVMQVGFQLPPYLIVTRALSAYFFAFIAMLHTQIGQPQEVNRLMEKDNRIDELTKHYEEKIAALRSESAARLDSLQHGSTEKFARFQTESHTAIDRLNAQLQEANSTISRLNDRLSETEKAKALLANSVQKASDTALQAYSQDCQNWLKSGIKTALVDDIATNTGISKRRILAAIRSKKLQTASRNHDLVLVPSLMSWMETQTVNEERDTDETPVLHLVNG